MNERIQLARGATIKDVYADFFECAGGGDESIPVRSLEELRDVIPTGVRYEECDRVSVSYAWAQCFDVPPDVRFE